LIIRTGLCYLRDNNKLIDDLAALCGEVRSCLVVLLGLKSPWSHWVYLIYAVTPWQGVTVVQTALPCPVTPWQCHDATHTVNVTTRYSKNTVPPIANTAKTEPSALLLATLRQSGEQLTLIILRAVTSCGRHGVVTASRRHGIN